MSNNSSQSSPSLLNNLRQYRFQKTPSSSSASQSNGFSHTNSASSSASQQLKSGSQVYKRIRVMDSESENESSPPPKKIPVVLDTAMKERRLNNMVEMFPEISTVIVKTILTKHDWNEERSRDELLKFDPEQEEINNSVFHQKMSAERQFGIANGNGGKIFQQAVYSNTAKKKTNRRRNEEGSDEDSDFDSRKAKNEKVFDSDDDSDVEINNDLYGYKKKVYEFLSNAKLTELQQLQGCSLKKAEVIMSLRPFKGWIDMVERFQSNKHVNTDLLNSTQEVLHTRNNVEKLMKKCTNLAMQMESAVAAATGVKSQPASLEPSLKLAPYQLVGLNWLTVMHHQKVNGILADEMGLGKTVQVIAFLAYLKETKQSNGTHLIVVPASTLENWNQEFLRWCPSIRVGVYYGNQEERRSLRIEWARGGLSKIDVVLTTYNLVSSSPEERKMFRVTPMHYVVFDEAHMLKNMATQRYENLIRIKASHRILLTGTPLQNNLLELMSLLCFVMPHLFAHNTDDLKSLFQRNSKTTTSRQKADTKPDADEVPPFEQTQISQAKRIMKPFLLRRLKRDVLKDLPSKTDHKVICPMSSTQNLQYKDLIYSFSSDGIIHATNEQSGMSMMMDMRKLSNHPLLLRFYYDEEKLRKMAHWLAADTFYKEKNEQYIYEDMLCMSDFQIHQMTFEYKSIVSMKVPNDLILTSGKFAKLDEMLPKLKSENHRVLIFSQFTMMLDILEPYLKLRKHEYLRLDGSTLVTSRQDLIDRFNSEPDIFIFLLSTRAGGLGINLTAADTVIIHDMDFNPYNDKQAEDRCHRMGQKRPVTIYRFISGGTIEEGIYQVAQEKLSLERDITNTDENEPHEMKNVVRLLNSAFGISSK